MRTRYVAFLPLLALTIAVGCARNAPPEPEPMFQEVDLTKPEKAARWETGADNLFKSKIVVVKLKALRGTLTKAGHETAEAVAVEVCGALTDGVSAEQRQALDLLVKNEAELYPAVRAAIYDFYEQAYESYRKGFALGAMLYGGGDISEFVPKVVAGDELDKLVVLQKIFIHRPQGGGVSIGIECDCSWDEEHGLGVLISGDGVIKAGLAEVAYPPN